MSAAPGGPSSAAAQRRQHLPTVVVALLAACFGGLVPIITDHLSTMVQSSELNASGTAGVLAQIGVLCLVVVSVVVAALVIRTTLQHVVEERRSTIALRRLLGATAAGERRVIVREALGATMLGTVAGLVLAVALGVIGTSAAISAGVLAPGLDYAPVPVASVVPAIAVLLAALAVARSASASVLQVSPMEALGASSVPAQASAGIRMPVALLVTGAVVLAGAVAIGSLTPIAVLVGVVGGVVSFSGIVGLAPAVLPRLLSWMARLVGRRIAAKAALEAAAQAAQRSSGIVLALLTGTAAVTMFVVAGSSFTTALHGIERNDVTFARIIEMIDTITVIIGVLVGFSGVIAIIGFVTSLLTSVRRRTREIGLLRALGMRASQVRSMIGTEAVLLALVGVVGGLIIGSVYGWIGTWTFVGSVYLIGAVVPTMPLWFAPAVLVAGCVVALVAGVPATSRARRIAPIAAMAEHM